MVRLRLLLPLLFIPTSVFLILLAVDIEVKSVAIIMVIYALLFLFNIIFDVWVPTNRIEIEILDSTLRVIDKNQKVIGVKWTEIRNYRWETSSLFLSFVIYYGNKKKLRFPVLDKKSTRLSWLDCMERIEQNINEKGNPSKSINKYRGLITGSLILTTSLIALWLYLNGYLSKMSVLGPLLVLIAVVLNQVANLYRKKG